MRVKNLFVVFAGLFLLLQTAGFGGPEDWALSVVIQPETPTIYDSIEIISTGVRGSGPVTVENTFFQIDEAALTLDIFLNVGFLTVVSPWHYTENIGTLPGGVYDLTVTAYADYGPPETFFTSLNVVVTEPNITVNWDGTGDYLTIQDAIDAAVYGDTVQVFAGRYVENITLKNGVAVVGEGADKCIIDGSNRLSVVSSTHCDQNTLISGFKIVKGWGTINQNGANLGGGIRNLDYSSPTIIDCIFESNSADFGGGIYNQNRCHPLISNCIFKGNTAKVHGGAIYSHYTSNPVISNCIIQNNLAWSGGGGVLNARGSNPKIDNCIFNNNIVQHYNYGHGGGLFNLNTSPVVRNCVFIGNKAIDGGGIYNYAGEPVFINCIIRLNIAVKSNNEIHNNDSLPVISFSNIYGSGGSGSGWKGKYGVDGGGNIDEDPFFVSPAEKNFRLMFESPCIDMGDPDSKIQPGATDLDGNPRIDNGIVDMGAYEFIHSVKVSVDIKPQTCPNPVNVKSKGVLPVAILGSDVLDVNDIELDTILLEGVGPLRGSYEDVAAPVIDETECACTLEGADGYMDLTLKFKTQEVITGLGEMFDGETWMLNLTGYLKDGTPIEGADCIIIKSKGKDGIVNLLDFAKFSSYWLRSACSETNNWCDRRDINESDQVDLDDLMVFIEHWREGTSPWLL